MEEASTLALECGVVDWLCAGVPSRVSGRSLTLWWHRDRSPQQSPMNDGALLRAGCALCTGLFNCRIRRPGLPYRRRQLKSRGSPCEHTARQERKRMDTRSRGPRERPSPANVSQAQNGQCNVSELLMIDEYKGENEREDRGQIQTSVN